MVDTALLSALRAALREHEIGEGSPYRLCFAKKGKSGASFGFMQGDLAAGQAEAKATFKKCLTSAGYQPGEITKLLAALSVHCPINPLSSEQTERINDALEAGSDLVDAMDATILDKVIKDVDHCIDVAEEAGHTTTSEAVVYIALWVNMTGAPTELLRWLAGKQPRLPKRPAPAPKKIDGDALENYLACSYYYTENPKNFARIKECVSKGLKALNS